LPHQVKKEKHTHDTASKFFRNMNYNFKYFLVFKALIMMLLGMVVLCCQRNPYLNLQYCNPALTTQQTPYRLLMLSNTSCGYCAKAKVALIKSSFNSTLHFDIIEFDRRQKTEQLDSVLLIDGRFTIIDGSSCQIKKPKFFPYFYLYDSEKNMILWKEKGWDSNTLQKVNNRIK